MTKKTLHDITIDGEQLLIRVDFNVPFKEDGTIADDWRIRAALPTLEHALEHNASMVLMTHLGRPEGQPDPRLQLDRVAQRLGELLPDRNVQKCDEVVGRRAKQMADALQPGDVLVLENLRFHKGEKENDAEFASQLRELGHYYVNDAFAACHRQHASMVGVAEHFPEGNRVIGMLVERELRMLDQAIEAPNRPLVVLLGGAKVADKIGVIESLLDRADQVLLGGAMAYTFLRARDRMVGRSPVETDQLELARRLLGESEGRIVLPEDHLIGKEADIRQRQKVEPQPGEILQTGVVKADIPDAWYGMDIGPKTMEHYRQAIFEAGTVLWNGPMGKFEIEDFRQGTRAIIEAMADSDATTIAGGGETGEAVEQMGLAARLNHVSTGGGAFLVYLKNRTLAALAPIAESRVPAA